MANVEMTNHEPNRLEGLLCNENGQWVYPKLLFTGQRRGLQLVLQYTRVQRVVKKKYQFLRIEHYRQYNHSEHEYEFENDLQ